MAEHNAPSGPEEHPSTGSVSSSTKIAEMVAPEHHRTPTDRFVRRSFRRSSEHPPETQPHTSGQSPSGGDIDSLT